MTSATLYDFRDVDLMHKLVDESDNDGWIETAHLARALGFNDDGFRNVGTRLGWMRKYGMLDRDEESGLWRLSPSGDRILKARLRAAQARELEALPAESLVEVMANVVQRYRFVDVTTAAMLRREFRYGTAP